VLESTYIRTLIDDMGQFLGCGAYVQELHRSWIEGVEGPMLSLADVLKLPSKRIAKPMTTRRLTCYYNPMIA